MEDTENGGLDVTEIPHGRRLTPVGDIYRTTQTSLMAMSDAELKSHIDYLNNAVRDAATMLDVRRTMLFQAVNEQEFRLNKVRRNWRASTIERGDPISHTPGGIKISVVSRQRHSKLDKIRETMQNPQSLADTLAMLEAIARNSKR